MIYLCFDYFNASFIYLGNKQLYMIKFNMLLMLYLRKHQFEIFPLANKVLMLGKKYLRFIYQVFSSGKHILKALQKDQYGQSLPYIYI